MCRDPTSSKLAHRQALNGGRRQEGSSNGRSRLDAGPRCGYGVLCMGYVNGTETSARNSTAIVRLSPEDLEARGALAATDWSSRVDFVEELMCAVSWTPITGRALAKLWGLSGSSVSLMANEASRRITRAYREAPEEVVARLCAGLDHVVQVALGREKHIGCKQCGSVTSHADPDCTAAIKGQVALAQILGLAPSRHDMELKYEALDDAALLKTILRSALGTPHLRPVLLAELENARNGLLEAPMETLPALPGRVAEPEPEPEPATGRGGFGEPAQETMAEVATREGASAIAATTPAAAPPSPNVMPPGPQPRGTTHAERRAEAERRMAEKAAKAAAKPAPVTHITPPPAPDCACGHDRASHYALKACWRCHCLTYAPKET